MAENQLYQRRQRYLPILFAILGSILMVNLVGPILIRIEPLEVLLNVRLGFPGQTVLKIPPVGNIRAKTHGYLPLLLTLTLDNIDLDNLRSVAFETDLHAQAALVQYFSSKIDYVVMTVILKLLLIAGVGGLLGVFLYGKRNWRILLVGFLVGALFLLLILGGTYFTYDINAFATSKYEGIIEAAPWMISLIQEGLVKVDELGSQIQVLANNLYTVFNQIENLKHFGILESDLSILLVSDIHNHPVAFDFINQVIATFPVDLLIDIGDLTDWATPLEAEIVRHIDSMGVTYLFVSGNHESPEIMRRLAETDNVIILDNQVYDFQGLKILGIADPAALNFSPATVPLAELNQIADEINLKYRDADDAPDILAVHNHRIANRIEADLFPVIVFGHNHVQSFNQVGSTVYINPGSTGAAGIRGVQTNGLIPFSLSILYFSFITDSNQYQLTAVDSIQVQSPRLSFSLDRTFVTDPGRNLAESVENL